MRMTASHTQTERNRQDKSARCAKKNIAAEPEDGGFAV
jgi:hypothetical protein